MTTTHLHIGLPKSGTTYVQQMVEATRDEWEAKGWLIARPRDQVQAAQDAIRQRGRLGAWSGLVDTIDSWSGTDALISVETLCRADREAVDRIVESVSGSPVRVLITARDIARSLPAQWQQSTQHRKPWTWAEYSGAVMSGERSHQAARSFWSQHDLPKILDRWTAAAGVDNVCVVTVPHPGGSPDVLWQRFTAALGVTVNPVADLPRANEALGAASAELLVRLNQTDQVAAMTDGQYNRVIRAFLARQVLADRRADEPKVGMASTSAGWADNEAERIMSAIRSSGVAIFGDIEDLRPRPEAFIPAADATPSSDVEAAVEQAMWSALIGAVDRLASSSLPRDGK